jgi:tellurite resistance protein
MGQCMEKNVHIHQPIDSLDSTVKAKKTNGTSKRKNSLNVLIEISLAVSKSNQNVISVLKSDTISVLKPDDHLEEFFADTTKDSNDESTVQLNTDDMNRIAENTTR